MWLLHGREVQAAGFYLVVPAVEIDSLAREQLSDDGEKLCRLGVTLVVRRENPVASEFGRIAANDDVQQQAAHAHAVECGRLARGVGR